MKKLILLLLLVVVGLFLAAGLVNLAVPSQPADRYSAIRCSSPEMEAAKRIIGAKCIMCHSKDPNLPFYAQLPWVGTFIQKHVAEATGMMNLQELVAGTSTDKWAYDRLAHVITIDTMPIKSYLSLHWNGKLTEQEKVVLLEWIEQRRAISQ